MASITRAPIGAVYGLSVKRDGYTMRASWKIPPSLNDSQSPTRVTYFNATWALGVAGNDPNLTYRQNGPNESASHVSLNSFEVGRKTYTRSSFYPLTKRKLSAVTCKVLASNKGGSSPKEPSTTYQFKLP